VEDVKHIVVSVYNGKPVFLKDVANVKDGTDTPDQYHMIGFNNKITEDKLQSVTLAISKRKGSDAVVVARKYFEKAGAP